MPGAHVRDRPALMSRYDPPRAALVPVDAVTEGPRHLVGLLELCRVVERCKATDEQYG